MKQMFRPQRPHQRVLNEIVSELGVAGERPRIASQRRDRSFDSLPESDQRVLPSNSTAAQRLSPIHYGILAAARIAPRQDHIIGINTVGGAIFPARPRVGAGK
jgi:hypothetical protein